VAHRAKHRTQAQVIRAGSGRTIKSDLNPDGTLTPAYCAAQERVVKMHGSIARAIASASARRQAAAVKDFLRPGQLGINERKKREPRLLPVQGYLRGMW
jgi:hypothetical protein